MRVRVALLAVLTVCAAAPVARASFPFRPQGSPYDYSTYHIAPTGAPASVSEFTGPSNPPDEQWMYASTAASDADAAIKSDARELDGVRGAHLFDPSADIAQGWRTTTGRPDVVIAILDSGIKWNDRSAMIDDRRKTHLNKGELKKPLIDRATALDASQNCATFDAGGSPADPWDVNKDGVFNILDYACDSRVSINPAHGAGPADLLDPEDVLIAFTDGVDDDHNGYADDIVGWDFLDDDNDPYDDVQYGHGTGESRDSSSEADNYAEGGDALPTCPNCTQIYLRVGTSFIADINRFAEATMYATDNGVDVIQEALGTLNKSSIAGQAVKYAYDHGTTVIASAADEAAQHHNWPSSFPYAIVVNSVTHTKDTDPVPPGVDAVTAAKSYTQFNGCTNFSSRITLAIPSVSCSSDATGKGSGMAGLVYSAALDAIAKGKLTAHGTGTCVRVDGTPCPITPNEVRQIMASGLIGSTAVADDINFAQTASGVSLENPLGCQPTPLPACTDPFLAAPTTRTGTGVSYPARKGFDQFYGYGRANMATALNAVLPSDGSASKIPPEVEVTSPGWFDMVDPSTAAVSVKGTLDDRGGQYTCKVYVAPGSYAGESDFTQVSSSVCNGAPRSAAFDGEIASVPMATLKGLFNAASVGDFSGREQGLVGNQTYSGRPDTEPYGFTVKVVATSVAGNLTGQDHRQAYLHHDADLLAGYPKQLPGDVESSPVLADLDGDNQNELIIANSDGVIHAFKRGGGEAPGFPVHTEALRPDHASAAGFKALDVGHEAVLATPAVGDIDGDGVPEVVVADMDRNVYIFAADGTLEHEMHTNPRYAGIPGQPFVNLRHGVRNRTQEGALASPVLADLDGDGKQEIILASLDRHVYAWHSSGDAVDGFPALVVDRSKVASIDPDSHQITFSGGSNTDDSEQQGAIVDTPAVGDLDGDGKPEIVVGTNEEYDEPINDSSFESSLYTALQQAGVLTIGNGRLFVLKHTGIADNLRLNNDVYRPGWPFKIGMLERGVLPLVGEGVLGNPIIGSVACKGAAAPRIGAMSAAGLAYLIDPDGKSCLGQSGGTDQALPTTGGATAPGDPVFLPAFGSPAFGTLGATTVMLTPAAGALRALDVAFPEYQTGHDYLVAYDTATGTVAPGWPAQVNDLQFLTGPSVADIDALPGQEVLEGTASDDLQAFNAAGASAGTNWPKLTGDWTIASSVVGPFGDGATKVIIGGTRSGRISAFATTADACAPGDWPEFHHDPANSGDMQRDAIEPGHPTAASMDAAKLKFTATGDDLQCGTATSYQIVTSDSAIDAGNFKDATPITNSAKPQAVGSAESLTLPAPLKRYVAVRAVDDQGNVGRPAVVDRGDNAPANPEATPTAGPSATASATATATVSPTATPGTTHRCVDHKIPYSRFTNVRLTRTGARLRGRTVEPGCARIRAIRVAVSRYQRGGSVCRPLKKSGRFGSLRGCRHKLFRRARGGRRWHLTIRGHLPAGKYIVFVRAVDTKGNFERRSKKNRVRITVR